MPHNLDGLAKENKRVQFTRAIQIANDIVIVIGGQNSNTQECLDRVLEYNMDTKIFNQLPHMKTPRWSFSVIFDQRSDTIYVLGGTTGKADSTINLVESYHFPTRKWSDLPDMTYPRANACWFLIGDYIYAMSGFLYEGNYMLSYTFERHKIGTDYWQDIKLLPEFYHIFIRASSTPFIFQDQIYHENKISDQIVIMGGWSSGKGFIKDINMIDCDYFNEVVEKLNSDSKSDPRENYFKHKNENSDVHNKEKPDISFDIVKAITESYTLHMPIKDMITKPSKSHWNMIHSIGTYGVYLLYIDHKIVKSMSIKGRLSNKEKSDELKEFEENNQKCYKSLGESYCSRKSLAYENKMMILD